MRTYKTVVYSAITGDKDEDRNDVLMFGEYDRFKDPNLNAKIYKVLPHKFFNAQWSIWIDGNVTLKVPAEELIQIAEKTRKDIVVFANPYRDCIYAEAEYCIEYELANPAILRSQIEHYQSQEYAPNKGLGACYIIIRKHTKEVERLNEAWWAEICRWSRRDQVSFPYVMRDKVFYLESQSNDNRYFKRVGHKKAR